MNPSVVVTPDELTKAPAPDAGVVIVVSEDARAAVDACCAVDVRHAIYVGSTSDPALAEMRSELYDYKK